MPRAPDLQLRRAPLKMPAPTFLPCCSSRRRCCRRRASGPRSSTSTACSPTGGCTSERGEDFKAFSTLDGHGPAAAAGGIEPIVVTGRIPRRAPSGRGSRPRARRLRRWRQLAAAQGLPGRTRTRLEHRRRDGRRLARPASADAGRVRLRAASGARRGARPLPPRDPRRRRPRRSARMLRPAAVRGRRYAGPARRRVAHTLLDGGRRERFRASSSRWRHWRRCSPGTASRRSAALPSRGRPG